MPTNTAEIRDLPIKDLSSFAAGLNLALQLPTNEKLRAVVAESLSAECVQCAIRLSGADLLKYGRDEFEGDARLERLRTGYCARNGCDCLFYRVTCAAHPEIDWPKLIHPTCEETPDEQAEAAQRAASRALAKKRVTRIALRTAVAVAALAVVFILRQIYVGGTIPFIRQPEEFQVDHNIDAR